MLKGLGGAWHKLWAGFPTSHRDAGTYEREMVKRPSPKSPDGKAEEFSTGRSTEG